MSPGILSGKGVNAQRKIFGRPTADDELIDLQASSAPPMWVRAVVEDVILDDAMFSTEKKLELTEKLVNPELLDKAPRNSLIAQPVTNAEGRRFNTPAIFYPMLSHIASPIKPGEHVWVMFENPERSSQSGYWLSRIVEPLDVDDLNFTHADRKFDDRNLLTPVEKALGLEVQESKPGFPNGGNTGESFTLQDPKGYEKINDNAVANGIVTKEVAPRYTKRPGDLVFAGSNNTLICLGEDRTGPAYEGHDSIQKPAEDEKLYAGTIDLVVGRARELPESDGLGEKTSPAVITNSRGEKEVDKVIKSEEVNEGNPDFEKDSARIYISMKTFGDLNFKTTPDLLPKDFNGELVKEYKGESFVCLKGDHIRIISRQDDEAKQGAINGSIRIVKQGIPDDESGKGRGALMIEPDGSVIIDGPHITIGSANLEKGHGAGTHISLGQGATEPLMLGNATMDLFMKYSSDMRDKLTSLESAITLLLTDLSSPPGSLGNFGVPLPISAATPNSAAATIPKLKKFTADITNITKSFQDSLPKTRSKIAKTR